MITRNNYLCPQIGPKARTRRSNAVSAVRNTTSERRGTRAWRHRVQCSASLVSATRYANSLSAEPVSSTMNTTGHVSDVFPPSSQSIAQKSSLNMIPPSTPKSSKWYTYTVILNSSPAVGVLILNHD
jgi:hypothetical protein